jgi:hypothetical protein
VKPRCLSVSQSGNYFVRGCAAVNVFMNTITIGCFGMLILHAVYVLGINRKILLSLYSMCIPSVKLILNLHNGGGIKVHSTLLPLNGLLCQPRVIMIMEKSVE